MTTSILANHLQALLEVHNAGSRPQEGANDEPDMYVTMHSNTRASWSACKPRLCRITIQIDQQGMERRQPARRVESKV